MHTMNLAISIILLLFFEISCQEACPSTCTCKWTYGKLTAECTGKGLTVIPSDLKGETQIIDVSRNHFTEIASKTFFEKKLENLQRIFISECGITKIASDAFYKLNNLIELDLSGNKLLRVPNRALENCVSLRKLQLAHNPISEIETGAFASLAVLTNLGLSNCNIKHLQSGALDGLKSLKNLEMDGNQLVMLSIEVFNPLVNLHELNLYNNPWKCDCKVRDIIVWMEEHKIPLSIPPGCAEPQNVKELSWSVTHKDEFACVPEMKTAPSEVTVIIGRNASLMCEVNASPKSSVYWEVGGRNVKNLSSDSEHKGKYSVISDEFPGRQTSMLTIYNVEENDGNFYMCYAENKAGSTSRNYTLIAVSPDHLGGAWSGVSITLLLVGVILLILLAAAAICFLVHHPSRLPFASKIPRSNVIQQPLAKKQDAVEMNDVSVDKEEKDNKVVDKQPRHETGSSGYGSDQLTPDLVSKIADMNNGPSLSASNTSCNHFEANLLDGYGSNMDPWPLGKAKPSRYDGSPMRGNNMYSEIYMNPCYGRDEDPCNYAMPSADFAAERGIPQNDRVRTLRSGYDTDDYCTSQEDMYKRYPVVVANASGHYTLPPKTRFSPDEGYAEEGLEGTEV